MTKSIVIPVYNESSRIGLLLNELSGIKMDVFIVDDCSSDNTSQIIKKYVNKNPHLFFLKHSINLGKGAALRTGCDAAFSSGAGSVIVMDGDGQHDPSDIPLFTQALETGKYDIIFGSRNYNLSVPFVRFAGNKIASVLISLLFGIYVSDSVCGFRAFTKKAYEKILWQSQGYGIEVEMIIKSSKAKLKFKEVPIKAVYHDRTKGVTIMDGFAIFFDILKWRLTI